MQLELTEQKKRALKFTILLIALTHMPVLALSPATEQIRQYFNMPLASVQTAMSFSSVIQIVISLVMMALIDRAIITKKFAIVVGQLFFGVAVAFVLLQHEMFWTVWVLSILVGCALGCYVTNAFGITFDCFPADERQKLGGYQTSCINGGGILMSLAGGLLAGYFWYGGYLIFAFGIVIAIVAYFNIPSYKTPKPKQTGGKRAKIHPKIYFYAVITLLYMMCNSVIGQNLSTHLSASFTNYSSLAGVLTSVQMAGGVISGLFFGKLSNKLKDDMLVLSLCFLFTGFLLLSLFPANLPIIFIAVFLAGSALSMFLPWTTFGVSVYSDPTNSAITSVIISSIAPSAGGFLSPVVFTNLTNALVEGSTVFRYRFVGGFALIVAIGIFVYNRASARKAAA